MITRRCDGCGMVVEDSRPGRGAGQLVFQVKGDDGNPPAEEAPWHQNRIRVRVVVDVDGTSNAGDVCVGCIRLVVSEGDVDRV
jgi:hypothetical protein